MKIAPLQKRTLQHGEVAIVAYRTPTPAVHMGATQLTPSAARDLAAETPPGPGAAELARKLREQADWAEGRDL